METVVEMKQTDFLFDRMKEYDDRTALCFQNRTITYADLLSEVDRRQVELNDLGVSAGSVVLLKSDYNLHSVAVLYALIRMNAIIVPMLPDNLDKNPEILTPVPIDLAVAFDSAGTIIVQDQYHGASAPAELIDALRNRVAPGLVLFTSGSSGRPKAVVHDFGKLLEKFRIKRGAFKTVNFLMFDHWGGLNTLLHNLSNGSFVVLPEKRTPAYVLQLISDFGLELLPVSPSFLNMLIISGAASDPSLDTSSLKLVTYGAEPMPEATLRRARELFPNVEFRQTYGLIELGVLRAKSKGPDSLWVKVGGEGYDVRIRDGMLEIRSESAMLGYLNAPSPFTEDGYFMTQDKVLVDGDYIKILGRESEQINTGGEKVYPQEVENVLIQHEHVQDAMVYGKKHVLLGKVLIGRVQVAEGQDTTALSQQLKLFCRQSLEAYKIPVKFEFTTDPLVSQRLKKSRAAIAQKS